MGKKEIQDKQYQTRSSFLPKMHIAILFIISNRKRQGRARHLARVNEGEG